MLQINWPNTRSVTVHSFHSIDELCANSTSCTQSLLLLKMMLAIGVVVNHVNVCMHRGKLTKYFVGRADLDDIVCCSINLHLESSNIHWP